MLIYQAVSDDGLKIAEAACVRPPFVTPNLNVSPYCPNDCKHNHHGMETNVWV